MLIFKHLTSPRNAARSYVFHSFTLNFHIFVFPCNLHGFISLLPSKGGNHTQFKATPVWLSKSTRSRRLFTCSNSRYTRGFISYDLWTYLQSVSIGYQHAGSRNLKQRSCDWERALGIRQFACTPFRDQWGDIGSCVSMIHIYSKIISTTRACVTRLMMCSVELRCVWVILLIIAGDWYKNAQVSEWWRGFILIWSSQWDEVLQVSLISKITHNYFVTSFYNINKWFLTIN